MRKSILVILLLSVVLIFAGCGPMRSGRRVVTPTRHSVRRAPIHRVPVRRSPVRRVPVRRSTVRR